jgi:hypothetical protein
MKSIYLEKSIEIIFDTLKGIISENEYSLISARKNEGEKYTQTIFKTFETDKLSRITLEEYTVNSNAYGVVLNIYPKCNYDIPIFTFQLGGQIPDKVIFVVDIIPTIKSDKFNEVKKLYSHYSSVMTNLGSQREWINEICSENAIICQYKPLDPELILKALSEYLNYWKEVYINTTKPVLEELIIEEITRNILNFKKILHANDAGLEIYLKKFGKEAHTAIEAAAFGAYPSLEIYEPQNLVVESAPVNNTLETNSEFNWTKEAADFIQEAPKFVRSKIKGNAEKKAKELGLKEITRDFVEKLRK